MTDEERFREEFRYEVRRLDADVRRIDDLRAKQELGFTTLKGDITRLELQLRTGSAMTIGEAFLDLGRRVGAIEAGESERKDFQKWMKRVFPYTVIALVLSLIGAMVTLYKVQHGG